jgi:Domain of unknown function (DUF4190)
VPPARPWLPNWEETMTTPQPAAQPQPTNSNAVISLVVGIVGIFFCGGILCPIAWYLGAQAEQQIDASGGAEGGRGIATAGKIIGIIGTVLFLIWLVIVIIALIAGTSVWFIND